MFYIYTAPAFRASAAKAGTEQAETRPVTLFGNGGETVRHSLTDAQFAAWQAEGDAEKRAAILAASKRKVIGTGKVQVTKAALASWQGRVRAACDAHNVAALAAHEASIEAMPEKDRKDAPAFVPVLPAAFAASVLASGVIVLDSAAEDDTEDVLAGLFAE